MQKTNCFQHLVIPFESAVQDLNPKNHVEAGHCVVFPWGLELPHCLWNLKESEQFYGEDFRPLISNPGSSFWRLLHNAVQLLGQIKLSKEKETKKKMRITYEFPKNYVNLVKYRVQLCL